MKSKKSMLSMALTLGVFTCSVTHAKQIFPAELMGRELLIPGLGWAGHVGIATTDMMSPQGMGRNADQVIEVLNEHPVGQVNSIPNFKSRSKYWGSKYGVADRGMLGYNILVEANHQRWWCPKYTNDTRYHIGSGVPTTGQVYECGTWRCDTYVWWAFFSQGINTMPGPVWLPRVLFDYFPYFNDERLMPDYPLAISSDSQHTPSATLVELTPDELNVMSFKEFQMVMDNPPAHYVTSPSTLQMQLAYDSRLNDVKRGIMIDRLIADDSEPDLVKKLLALYRETKRSAVRDKIVEGLMLYNQRHRNTKTYVANEQPLLKVFFAELLHDKSLTSQRVDDVIRGFVDTHSEEEVMSHRDKIDEQLQRVDHYSSIMLKYTLVHKSKALQPLYIKSIVQELREVNNADLDSYFFGPLSVGYQGSGDTLLAPESKQIVADYLKEVRYKYTPQGLKESPQDLHRRSTAPTYFELLKRMKL